MTPDLVLSWAVAIFFIGLAALIVGMPLWSAISDAIEARHKRKLQLLREQRKEREAIDKAWDETFGKKDTE